MLSCIKPPASHCVRLLVSMRNKENYEVNKLMMDPFVISTFGKLGPHSEGTLPNLASVTSLTGVVDHGLWLSVSRPDLNCALVPGRGIVFPHCDCSRRVLQRTFVMVQFE
jgi:hypothetical protein